MCVFFTENIRNTLGRAGEALLSTRHEFETLEKDSIAAKSMAMRMSEIVKGETESECFV